MNKLLSLVAVFVAGCVASPVMPDGVVKQTRQVVADGQRITVDFYFRPGAESRPVALVSHGFLANRGRMSHWGTSLAQAGFIVAIPTHPTLADTGRNSRAIAALVRSGLADEWPVDGKTNGKAVLLGFSRGGMETLVAAALLRESVSAWVGIDPVDRDGQGKAAASSVHVPGLAVVADPSAWNDNGNARGMLADYAGPLRTVHVNGASHLDAESARGLHEDAKFHHFKRGVIGFLQSVPAIGLEND